MKWIVFALIFSCFYSHGQINITDYKFNINDSVQVIFSISEFDVSKHLIENCRIDNWVGTCLIDNKPVFGVDFCIPKFKIEAASVLIRGIKVDLDVNCMYQKPIEKSIEIKKCDGGFYLTLGFSDGAGTYLVQWKVIKNTAVRTIISNEEIIWQKTN